MTTLVRRVGLLAAVLATAAGLSIAAPRADAGPAPVELTSSHQ